MPGGTIRYVPLVPPQDGATKTSSASQWTIDFEKLENTINARTKMIVGFISDIALNLPLLANTLFSLSLGPQLTVRPIIDHHEITGTAADVYT